jgi:hypothetical protein
MACSAAAICAIADNNSKRRCNTLALQHVRFTTAMMAGISASNGAPNLVSTPIAGEHMLLPSPLEAGR